MSQSRCPGAPASGSGALAQVFDGARGDRRSLLKRAAGLGLAVPALGALGPWGAAAQDDDAEEHGHEATPASGYVGSDPGAASTGAEAPGPGEVQPFTRYDPYLPPVEAGTKQIEVVAKDATLYIADEVAYAAWTFDGTVPARMLRVVEGDTIDFTFTIDPAASTAHSLDFHSAITPPNKNYKTILPGESFSWSFQPKYPGAYMYHCGTPPVLMHIGSGMYGAMIVDPKEGWAPAQELAFVQSDFYVEEGPAGVMIPDYSKMLGHGNMDYVVFNGHAQQYVTEPITVKAGEPVRIFVVNAGPNVWSSFHVVGTIFDSVYINGNPNNRVVGLQSISIGPGDGAVVEFTLPEPGTYPAVNHAFGHAAHGAIALLQAE